MTDQLYRLFYATLLFIGLSTPPFLSFSQQKEELRRVTVVVTTNEVAVEKEIVQLPADNVPKTVNSRPKEITTVRKSTTTLFKAATTPTIISKTATTEKKSKPTEKAITPITKSKASLPNINVSKEVAKVSHSTKVNSFSYIWIGIFLTIAGLVLGLLFGKPAFIISFVGVVFIVLGLVI